MKEQLLQLRTKLLAEIDELRRLVGERPRPLRVQGLAAEIRALGIERDRLVVRASIVSVTGKSRRVRLGS